MRQTILKFLYHDVKTVINTDGGGMMGTTLLKEYDEAKRAIQRFKKVKIGITIEDYVPASNSNTSRVVTF